MSDEPLQTPADVPTSTPSAEPATPVNIRRPRRTRVLLGVLAVLTLALVWRGQALRDAIFDLQQGPGETVAAFYPPVPAFQLDDLTIPKNEIRSGGPPKDGIPALTNPKLVAAGDARFLQPNDRVAGVVMGDSVRAYPLKILNYHEIVNDRLGKVPIVVTYCPLCDSVAVFDRRTARGEREFGVSGLLYNSNVLMYDRGGQPESLWSQIRAEGVSGPGSGKELRALPVELTTWSDWKNRYPETTVVSTDTGHGRDYSRNPYGDYFTRPDLMFPARPTSDRLPTKERVLGIWTDKSARAYPESAFKGMSQEIEQEIDGKKVVVAYDAKHRTLRVVEAEEGVRWMYSLWFAWYAFHPQTEVFATK